MAVSGSRVIKMTADGDVYISQLKGLRLKGIRLVSGTVKSTAKLRLNDANGEVVYSLAAIADASDECAMQYKIDEGTLHLTLSGTSAEVYLYVE